MALSRRTLWAGRLLLCAAPLIVVGGVPDLFAASRTAADQAALGLALALAFAVWLWFWLWAIESPSPFPAALAVGALAVLGTFLTLHAPAGRDALIFAAAIAGAGLRPVRGLFVVLAVAVLAGGVQVLDAAAPGQALGTAFNDLLVGLAAAGGRLLVLTNRELTSARGEIERLAVTEERLRFARDLHDLIGQSLTFAVLKSELVMRDLPGSAGPALRADLAQVRDAVRGALDDVRVAAAGYRQPGLAEELATARTRLASAGIQFELTDELGPLPVHQEAALAWALREGVTNVLRHSAARTCRLRLGRTPGSVHMELEDDGTAEGRRASSAGGGLVGVAERAAALGGSSAAGSRPGGGFLLEVDLPVRP